VKQQQSNNRNMEMTNMLHTQEISAKNEQHSDGIYQHIHTMEMYCRCSAV